MIEIIQQYWQSYLWTDGFQMTGVAMRDEEIRVFFRLE
jgi:hypothetical protein